LFEVHCGYCHLLGGMGTNLLTKQRIMAGDTPDKGLLANRTDLTADYVRSVVRMGKGAMPVQTRVDVTDAELQAVSRYLGKAG
jgi:mono/diheme cytochrome c family protein